MKRDEIKIGDRFGRLCVVGFDGYNLNLVCDCGAEIVRNWNQIASGNTKSCGCLKKDILRKRVREKMSIRGGISHTPTGWSWIAMMNRCYKKNNEKYPTYGGIGIVVCEYLRMTILNLVDVVGYRPEKHYIDRIDTYGNYSCGKCAECLMKGWPKNIRWATMSRQCRNKRKNRLMTVHGKTQCVSDWSDELGIDKSVLISRLNRGVSEDEFIVPAGQLKKLRMRKL
jgi:hypothetical protein